MKQARAGTFVRLRCAVRLSGAIQRAPQIALGAPLHIVGDEQIHLAVTIIVQPGGAGAEIGILNSGRLGDVFKLAVALVVEEMVAIERSEDRKSTRLNSS